MLKSRLLHPEILEALGRAGHPKIRNGCSGCSPRTGTQTVREPRLTKLRLSSLSPYLAAYGVLTPGIYRKQDARLEVGGR